jgi:hypothetical protein
MIASPSPALDRAARLLVDRLAQLEERLQEGREEAWGPFCEAVQTLCIALDHVTPGKRGELLTTAQMAERLALAPKTLLRRAARGEIRPALKRGKLIRWSGSEAAR